MHHPMRRSEQALTEQRCREILDAGVYGVLSLCDGGQPYGVPLNYAVQGSALVFHCSPEGRKMDALRGNPRVSFCVVGSAQLVSEEYTTRFESVVIEGTARILDSREEKLDAMMAICRKFSPAYIDKISCIRGDLKGVCLVRVEMESICGKRSAD